MDYFVVNFGTTCQLPTRQRKISAQGVKMHKAKPTLTSSILTLIFSVCEFCKLHPPNHPITEIKVYFRTRNPHTYSPSHNKARIGSCDVQIQIHRKKSRVQIRQMAAKSPPALCQNGTISNCHIFPARVYFRPRNSRRSGLWLELVIAYAS